MSLLDGPHVVQVYVEVDDVDDDQNPVRVPGDEPVACRGRMQPAGAEESAAVGVELTTLYRFITRSFPAGASGRVSFDGRDWDVVGEPMRRRDSATTSHDTVLLRARDQEVP